MIKRVLNLPAMPTAIVLGTLSAVVAAVMNQWLVTLGIVYFTMFAVMFGCPFANMIRYSRMERHELSWLSDRELRYLCSKHPEIEVRFYDSVRSGNCMAGTSGFVKRTFKGRKSITLPELARYVGAHRVKNVIVYKLKTEKVEWKTELECYRQAQRAGTAEDLAAA
ncbi:MAG TPA: hypothetical protein V6D22_07575 [Candidatus Obscuribacterales bacterium]